MSLFHINTCSLPKNFEELEFLLDKTKIDFDVIIISESKINKDKSAISSINLKGNLNFAPRNLQQVPLCYTLVIMLPTHLEMIYVFTNLQN